MSKVTDITSALTGEKMKIFDLCKDNIRFADDRSMLAPSEPSVPFDKLRANGTRVEGPAPPVDSYTGPNDKPVSLDFNSLLNGRKPTSTQ